MIRTRGSAASPSRSAVRTAGGAPVWLALVAVTRYPTTSAKSRAIDEGQNRRGFCLENLTCDG
jgi:hypothetical protein